MIYEIFCKEYFIIYIYKLFFFLIKNIHNCYPVEYNNFYKNKNKNKNKTKIKK